MKFTDALDRSLEDVKRPPNPPIGHYVWQVSKHPDNSSFEAKSTGKTFDRVEFTVKIVSPMDDVDPDDLADYGDVSGFTSRNSFLFDNEDEQAFERSLFNLKRFFEHLGLTEGEIAENLANSVGAQFVGELKHRPDPTDPEIVYAELGRTAPQ